MQLITVVLRRQTTGIAAALSFVLFSATWLNETTAFGGQVPAQPDDGRVAASEPCPLIDDFGQPALLSGTLSPFWAQEYIGADLAKEHLANTIGTTRLARVAVVDKRFDSDYLTGKLALLPGSSTPASTATGELHGNLVTNLINGLAPVGVSSRSEIVGLVTADITSDYMQVATLVNETQPQIVNFSKSFFEAATVPPALLKMAAQSILVISSGNSYPDEPLENVKRAAPAVLVGSLNADGQISKDSNEGPELTILAPSDRLIQSTSVGKKFESFGGTSGAAPLVSGTLADVVSILGDIELSEAKILVQRTAMPTLNARQALLKNGSGMLNQLKSILVAGRLKALGWPTHRKALLASPAVWDFASIATAQLTEGKELLRSPSCQERKQGLKLIRSSFLLASSDEEARQLLEDTYRGMGLTTNAKFYASFGMKGIQVALQAGLREQELSQPTLRGLEAIGAPAAPWIRELAQSSTAADRKNASVAATCLGGSALDLVSAGLSNVDPAVRRAVATEVWRLGLLAPPLLKSSLGDSDQGVRIATTISVARLGSSGSDLLMQAFQDSDEQVRVNVVFQSGHLKLAALKILRMALKDPSAEIRNVAAGFISNQNDLSLLAEAVLNADPAVRVTAIGQAQSLQEKGFDALKMLDVLHDDKDPGVQAALKKVLGARK